MKQTIARLATVVALLALASSSALAAEAWSVELTVQEPAGLARDAEPVSGGVPLPRGLVKDPSELTLVDAAGNAVPAQFSAINRWASDGSVCWLLVQAAATVPANGAAKFTLKPGAPARRNLLKVNDGADAVTVETGAIKFVVNKKRFNLIDAAWITAGDKEEQAIWSDPTGGSVVVLANGEVYASTAEPPTEVVVEESGPERATIMVRGLHKPLAQKQTLPYLYGYLVRIRAYAGQPLVRVSYALTNGHLPPIGSPLCKDIRIGIGLSFKADNTARGDGWVSVSSGNVRADLAARYLKENAPGALADDDLAELREKMTNPPALVRRTTWLGLKPWGDKEDFLDICSYKTYEMQLTLLPSHATVKSDDLLKAFNGYLRFWCPPEWVNSTDAWGDFGRVAIPDEALTKRFKSQFRPYNLAGWRDFGSTPEFESGSSRAPGGGYEPLIKTAHLYLGYLQFNDRRFFDQCERTSWHWRDRRYIYLDGDWSEKSWTGRGGVYYAYYTKGGRDFAAVQPANYGRYDGSWNYGGRYGPMDTQHFSVDEVVNYYYMTGDRQCLEALNAYGKQAASFVGGFLRAGKGKVGREHGWVTRALMSVYEATNDKRWFDTAQAAVKAIIDNQDKTAGTISPVNEKAKDAKTGEMVPVRHTPFMNAAVGMALGRYYRHHPEEDVRDAILGIADWLCYDVAIGGGFSYNWTVDNPGGRSGSGNRCMSTMAWAYLATGQQRYLDAADKHAGRIADWYQSGFGQEYVYIKTTKRPDAVPPAPVKDLAAEALGDGKVRLTWTAPGDDGTEGQAAEYQVKHAAKEIKERSDWRREAETTLSFWAAANVKGEPKPAQAGAKESFVVEGLAPGTVFFALKTYDEQPNQSDLSNVVKVEVK